MTLRSKNYTSWLTAGMLFFLTTSKAQSLVWSDHVGGTNGDGATSIAADAAGNVFVTGNFYGTVDFNPGPATFNLSAGTNYDAYLLKLDASGNFVWAKRFGNSGNDQGRSLCLDSAGNVYLSGAFSGTVDFDPGPGTTNLVSTAGSVFVVKLTNAGSFVWAKNYGGSGYCYSIALDQNANVYTAGHFTGTADFDPSAGTYNLTSAGSNDGYISKLDNSGNFVLARRIGGTSNDEITALAVDPIGNMYATGYYQGTCDFDPGPPVLNITPTGASDAFILKLDNSGNLAFAGNLQGTYGDAGIAIAIDHSNNILVSGNTDGGLDFDIGAGTSIYNSPTGSTDGFVGKYTSSGVLLWGTAFGDMGADPCRAVTCDSLNNVYIAGDFSYTVDFDPGPGTFNMTSNTTANDVYICKLDSAGNFRWAKGYGGTSNDWAYCLFVDNYQNVHVCGSFSGNIDVDPDGTLIFNAVNGGDDIYISKLNPCRFVVPTTLNVTGCDSFAYNSNNYTASGLYRHYFTTAQGCDSVVNLNLTINHATTGVDSVFTCGSYTWIDGNTYTGNNDSATYTFAGGAANGCDSVVTLHLSLSASVTGTDPETACDSLTWIDGITYTASNNTATFVFTGGAANGCDSTVTLNLQITGIDNSVMQNGSLLTANQPGAVYQWVSCDSNYQALPNDTMQTFSPTANGNYAVIITLNGCQDTSACVGVFSLGNGQFADGTVRYYPNPAGDALYLSFTGHQPTVFDIRLLDVHGGCVKQAQYDLGKGDDTGKICLDDISPGLYFLEIKDGVNIDICKVVVSH